ncbi:A24 family peptidase [Sphingomonas pokkalii]|uniref:Peptidase n=1 Tax=Sphingomonas pokkalii TaxID=2175090 RepID=A0A2U0SDW2_9SPHN|nr:prepilin peptidase [Sphingomonas pokkalii]PVX29572.1 peptidase [Sphingomonas pokkalii]
MGAIFSAVLLGTLVLLLLAAGVQDVTTREIGNGRNAAIALLAPAWWWAQGLPLWPDIGIQIGCAAGAFALFAGAFALGQMGGGDVKLIGAVALWLPLLAMARMLVWMALLGGVLTVAMLIHARLRRRPPRSIEVPYGVAIVVATLIALREPILNRFG